MSQETNIESIENDNTEPSKTGRFVTAAYNILGFVVGFLALFTQDNRNWITILLMYPLLGITIILFAKGAVKLISDDKSRIFGNISLGFLITSIFLVLKSTDDYTVYQNTNLWLPIIVISIVVLGGMYMAGLNPFTSKKKGEICIMLLVGLIYAYGFTREINCTFDYSDAKIYKATVLGRREYRGRHDSWYLTITPWGPRQYIKEEEIDGYLYDHVKIGDTVKVHFKQGLLNVPWFVVAKN